MGSIYKWHIKIVFFVNPLKVAVAWLAGYIGFISKFLDCTTAECNRCCGWNSALPYINELAMSLLMAWCMPLVRNFVKENNTYRWIDSPRCQCSVLVVINLYALPEPSQVHLTTKGLRYRKPALTTFTTPKLRSEVRYNCCPAYRWWGDVYAQVVIFHNFNH